MRESLDDDDPLCLKEDSESDSDDDDIPALKGVSDSESEDDAAGGPPLKKGACCVPAQNALDPDDVVAWGPGAPFYPLVALLPTEMRIYVSAVVC